MGASIQLKLIIIHAYYFIFRVFLYMIQGFRKGIGNCRVLNACYIFIEKSHIRSHVIVISLAILNCSTNLYSNLFGHHKFDAMSSHQTFENYKQTSNEKNGVQEIQDQQLGSVHRSIIHYDLISPDFYFNRILSRAKNHQLWTDKRCLIDQNRLAINSQICIVEIPCAVFLYEYVFLSMYYLLFLLHIFVLPLWRILSIIIHIPLFLNMPHP